MTEKESSLEAERLLVWGQRRVFVTPVLGCPAACEFCYLPETGESAPRKASPHVATRLKEGIEGDSRFELGRKGTLISLGCLSESLAPHSLPTTLKFLDLLAGQDNPIQLATRWVVYKEFGRFEQALKAAGVVLFHSITTISSQRQLERGTPSWDLRLKFLETCTASAIPSVLYIKPFLSGITAKDKRLFCELVRAYGVRHVVVGPLYAGPKVSQRLTVHLPKQWLVDSFRLSMLPVPGSTEPDEGSENGELRDFVESLKGSGAIMAHHSIDILNILRG